MMDLAGVLERSVGSMQAALKAVECIEQGLANQPEMEACASRMTAAMVVLCEMVQTVAQKSGRHPQEVLEQIIDHAVLMFPEEPAKEPRIEDMPSRPVKAGPSPWGWE